MSRNLLKDTSEESIDLAVKFAEAALRQPPGGDFSPIQHMARVLIFLRQSRDFWKEFDMDKARIRVKRSKQLDKEPSK